MILKTALISFLFLFQSQVLAHETVLLGESNPEVTQDTFFYYNFGRLHPNIASYARYYVKNTGSTPLNFLRATISGAFDYDAYHTCQQGLLPQQSCWFEIRYLPRFEGFHTARFVINFDQNNNIIVNVAGEAVRW